MSGWDVDGIEEARPPMQWRHTRQYDPFGKCFLLPGQCINVVLPRVKQRASDKLHGRSEEHIFMCYYERHGRCDGSVLTVPLRSLMTGTTSFALQRTRDWRASGEVSFPLARLREWQAISQTLEFGHTSRARCRGASSHSRQGLPAKNCLRDSLQHHAGCW